MKSPPSVQIRILCVAAMVAAALFVVAFLVTVLCYASDSHAVNWAKCSLCGVGWALIPSVVGSIAAIVVWADRLPEA